MSYDQVTGTILFGGGLLMAIVIACVDPKDVAPSGPQLSPEMIELRTRVGTVETRSVWLEGRLDHLRTCLESKMTFAENLYQTRVGILNCITASREP